MSNSVAISMKRLSWITVSVLEKYLRCVLTAIVYFLAVDVCLGRSSCRNGSGIANLNQGLFGMNVSALDQHPSWSWYIAFSVPVMVVLILVWIIFKYTPVSHNMQSEGNRI